MSIYWKYPYLLNDTFLKKIDKQRVQMLYIKVILLTWQENTIEEIEGIVTGGGLNVDGSSALRRTGSLSFTPINEDVSYDSLTSKFAINKKIKILFGIKNEQSDEQYPISEYPIIWFPQGVFYITGCSISHSIDNITVSLNIIDKMGGLNGKIGGTLPASVEFDKKSYWDSESQTDVTEKVIMYDIIMEAVNHWGDEQIGKILIGDLLKRSKKVLTWDKTLINHPIGEAPKDDAKQYKFWINSTQLGKTRREDWVDPESQTGELVEDAWQVDITINKSSPVGDSWKGFSGFGAVGYELTDFTYPGELVGKQGSAVTEILDKIKNALGNYEYFYDVDGNFRFQEIKNYLNTSLSSVLISELKNDPDDAGGRTSDTVYYYNRDITDNNSSYIVDRTRGKVAYDFSDCELVVSFNNNPDYDNIKNDFIIWGKKKNASGGSIPFRYHLAIDQKPPYGGIYYAEKVEETVGTGDDAYVANRYFKNFVQKTIDNTYDTLPTATAELFNTYAICEDTDKCYKCIKTGTDTYEWEELVNSVKYIAKDWHTELFFQGVAAYQNATDPGYYYAELANEWPKLYDLENAHYLTEIQTTPEKMEYFLDFIDTSASIGKYSVSQIGRRTKVIEDDSINCLFEPATPDLVFIAPILDYEKTVRSKAALSEDYNYNAVLSAAGTGLALLDIQHKSETDNGRKDLSSDKQLYQKLDKYAKIQSSIANPKEYTEMPTASEAWVDIVIKYVGATGGGYTHDNFYKGTSSGTTTATYSWTVTDDKTPEEKKDAQDAAIAARALRDTLKPLQDSGQTHDALIQECKDSETHYALPDNGYYDMTDEQKKAHIMQWPTLQMKNAPNGADTAAKDLLYQYTNFKESITLTTVPIYHLEPNTLIKVRDIDTGINDLYLIKSINYSFSLGSTMTINATKALAKI